MTRITPAGLVPTLSATLAACALVPVAGLAQDTRQLEAHVHGVSTLELAVEGSVVEMNLHSPGMDIVGFEYEASTDADKDAVEAAIRTMLLPENIVTLPNAAECRLTEVLAHLHTGGLEHEEGEHHDHAEEAAHNHEHEHEHEHEQNAHGEDHKDSAGHSEFHARYIFACEHPEDLTTIGFPFFESFGNAREIEAQFVTGTLAGATEIVRDAPELTLE
ncbi:DUF2796 domain-containing protein [Meridianimarinicoccus roseus]|uniref:DUF2796 domain-containing protein n=1 Tax=Meridianimarinicoccus roseus TaxID=2072018 RepID=A0A2V2LH84_9RHOB|nr:DUF2796 domain-containing protein [Meridianimarinicoccus roseus]PWR04312.1 DUF2796 domain-containing protein [Meridianimarinicoccus roseus]